MSEDDNQGFDGQRMFHQIYDHATQSQRENDLALDKSILTLSSGAIGLLISILNFTDSSSNGFFLSSVIFFGVTIVLVLISFVIGNLGIGKFIDRASDYYLGDSDDYQTMSNPSCYEVINSILRFVYSFTFVMALVLSIITTHVSFRPLKGQCEGDQKELTMKSNGAQKKGKPTLKKGATPPKPVRKPVKPLTSQPKPKKDSK